MNASIDISPDDLETVRKILIKHVPEHKVLAFGSRVAWTARQYSDLDLALMTAERLDIKRMSELQEAFVQSNLPFHVDIVDWASTSDSFRKIIEKECIVVQDKGPTNTTRKITVGEFAPFMYGKSLPRSKQVSSGDVPVFGSNGIVGYHDIALTDGPTIIIGRKGTIGRIHYSPVPCWPIDTTFFIVDSDIKRLRFKYYMLKSLNFEHMNSDSAVPGLNRDEAHACEVQIFSPTKQHLISHILGNLDDRIELNKRMSETLEAMAQTLFKSWFVDFDPIRAKMEGRWHRGKSLPGLSADLWDLLPDKLVDSEIGKIPKGWEIKSLDQIARFVNGLALQKHPPVDGKSLPIIKIAQLRAGHTKNADLASADLMPEYIVEDGNILFSWSGSLECVLWAGGLGVLNQHLFKVIPKNYPTWLCYLAVHHHLNDFRQIASAKATTMGHIQRHHLSDAKLALAPENLLFEIDAIIQPIVKGIWLYLVQSKIIEALRDALLPKLLSGDLRVEYPEKFKKVKSNVKKEAK